jgi:PHS family inorganic phosphate transporter-like MFS transporter
VTLHAYKKSIKADGLNELVYLDYCWRILIGLGCVPGVIALYFRLTIPETPRFTMDIDRDIQRAKADIENVLGPNGVSAAVYWVDPDAVVQRAEAPRQSRRDFIEYFARPSNLLLLFGVSYSWFAIDVSLTLFLSRRYAVANLHRRQRVAFYGLGLNLSSILTSDILTRAGIGSTPSELPTLCIYQSLNNAAIGSLVVSVAGLLPGYYASFFLIDAWGRKPIQFLGFAMSTVLLAVLGKMSTYQECSEEAVDVLLIADIYPGPHPDPDHRSRVVAFIAVFCLTNFFTNFGPNVTTFIIPGEIFPTRYRSTAHGISAACGKIGAIVSQIIFFKAPNSDKAIKVM